MPGFRFAPRTLLELGRELISSDEVALYELIKNAVDAGTNRIEVRANIILLHSAYVSALEALAEQVRSADVFRMVADTIYKGAGRDRIEAFLAPLEQAVGNRRTFKDALVREYTAQNWLEIRDRGHGMGLRELDEVFLTIGTRSRRAENVGGASYLGDKGVGRLSSMRLGDRLRVTTTRTGGHYWNVLDIDWSVFTHETEKELDEIEIVPQRGPAKDDVAEQGTFVRISHLNSDWSHSRLEAMFGGEIARMVDPFEPAKGNRLLRVQHDGTRILVPSIDPKLLNSAHAVCSAKLRFDAEGVPELTGYIDYKLKHKRMVVAQRGAEIFSLAQKSIKKRGKKGHAATEFVAIKPSALRDLGEFDVEIYWYNRRVVEEIPGLAESREKTRAEIRRWSGGPMLYRNGFRLLPYGNPENDWLDLDRNAFGQSGFKLNRQQVIGRIGVTSAHTAMSEQTNREGLVDSEPFAALRTIVMWLLHVEMRSLINRADALDVPKGGMAEQLTAQLRDAQQTVDRTLSELSRKAGPDLRPIVERLAKNVDALTEEAERLVGKTDAAVTQTKADRENFVHLAGIGLMTEFIFHELSRAVDHTLDMLPDARGPRREAALKSLEQQLQTLRKRISAFDELSGEKRQTKTTFDLVGLVQDVIENHRSQFERHHIEVRFIHPKPVFKVKAVKGMVVEILENLIVNSVYWLKMQAKHEKGFRPVIDIELDPDEPVMTVEDNGGGVDPSRRERIFEPFVTSKPSGEGRGLGLYISRELADHNGWTLDLDEEEGRRRSGRLSKFVLDMSAAK